MPKVDSPCGPTATQDTRPVYCFPVLAHGKTIGLLYLKARPETNLLNFRASQKRAQMCAEQISLAIANVQMRDQLHDRPNRGPLTGPYNRRHLTETLRRHLDRAQREDRPLSLLSLDVGHFKQFNDNHRHDAGDLVLRAVGSALVQLWAGDKTACCIGGGAFMLLLPGLRLEAAALRAEALRAAVERISVRYGEKTLPRVTASIGVAAQPGDGAVPQQLMKADDALYEAKGRGRNHVAIAGEKDPAKADTLAIFAKPQ